MASAAETAVAPSAPIHAIAWLTAPALVIILRRPRAAARCPHLFAPRQGRLWRGEVDILHRRLVQRILERDMFDDTVSFADGHLSILWRSVSCRC
jgi:hypothetical protein